MAALATVWLFAGIVSIALHLRGADSGAGSPITAFASVGLLFLGLAAGVFVGRWSRPVHRVAAIAARRQTLFVVMFWICFVALGLWMLRGSAASAPLGLGFWFGLMMGLSNVRDEEDSEQRYSMPSSIAAGLVVLGVLFGDGALRAVTLDGEDTVEDFREAGVDEAVRFEMHLCDAGACLTREDMFCGFVLGDPDDVSRCFNEIVDRGSGSIRLDDARKFCGSQTMKFTGRYSTERRCEAEGGRWGVKKGVALQQF